MVFSGTFWREVAEEKSSERLRRDWRAKGCGLRRATSKAWPMAATDTAPMSSPSPELLVTTSSQLLTSWNMSELATPLCSTQTWWWNGPYDLALLEVSQPVRHVEEGVVVSGEGGRHHMLLELEALS